MTLLTPEIAALVGKEVRYTAPEEVGRASIRYFALAVGDDNPLYTDPAYAREHGHPDVIAPPTMICETNQYTGLRRDEDGYPGHRWQIEVPGARLVRGGNAYVFHRPVRPSDVVTAVWRIDDVAERRSSTGEDMLIVTSIAEYFAADGAPLASNTETLIYLRAAS